MKRGIIEISEEFIKQELNQPMVLLPLFSVFIPIKIEYDPYRGIYAYYGVSEQFEDIKAEDETPKYVAIINFQTKECTIEKYKELNIKEFTELCTQKS